MESYVGNSRDMLTFIEKSPSCFHAVDNLKAMLKERGFKELSEEDAFELKKGEGYYISRNDSSLLAFRLPQEEAGAFHITSAHSDSPCFKVKENPEIGVEGQYVKLNVEKYGGMIDSTWLDRPLSVAGRIVVKEKEGLVSKLVNIDRDLLVIPNLAIHMNRDMNKGMEYNAQTDLLPLFGDRDGKGSFRELLAKEAKVDEAAVLGYDLYLYVREKGRLLGSHEEFVFSPRLDDLQCAYACMRALAVNVCVVFDNEEIGSGTRQGAASTFLADQLKRIYKALPGKRAEYKRMLAKSFMISADNAQAVHPNHPEKADPVNKPVLNGGIVIKYHGAQRYATDAITAAQVKELCREADVPVQVYSNRSDIAGGVTLGNISVAHVSVPTVDIGLPQLAMHSALETAGSRDTAYAVRMFQTFFAK